MSETNEGPKVALKLAGVALFNSVVYGIYCILWAGMQFIRRQQVLCLYRDLLRAAGRLEGETQRRETRGHIRTEFEQWRAITDEVRTLSFLLETSCQYDLNYF